MQTLRLPLYLLFSLLASLSFMACEDDPIDFEPPPEPPVVVDDELRLDGENLTGPTLNQGVHRFGVRFSESELLDYDGRELTGIRVFVGARPEYLDLLVYSGGDDNPNTANLVGEILTELPDDLRRFVEYEFENPIAISAEEPLWLVAEVELDGRQQSIGCDAGPRVAGGDWLWSNDRWEPFAERVPGESVNWNIRGVVR